MTVCAMAEQSVHNATLAITKRDEVLARSVIDKDVKLDQMEVKVEEACLKVLALHQPVAADLRFIIAVLKINNDLERIGDLGVNIAERAVFLANEPSTAVSFDFAGMAARAQAMLRKSIDALVNLDTELAREVRASDDEVDAMNRQMYLKVQEAIRSHPEQVESLIHLLSASRHLERMADHATNIAEDVIYMIEGEVIRHRAEEYKSQISH
ncbi:MAG: phosphate transport system regulatory protein PhoU [Planctomycetes bacterium RBG_16_55_9]|nr:MAG: phosphate transport system regulatory protein PhoU [Planctomycetes bacterium RBG_16_55_9]